MAGAQVGCLKIAAFIGSVIEVGCFKRNCSKNVWFFLVNAFFCGGRGRRWLAGASLKIGKTRRKGVPLTVQVITRGSWLFYLTRKYRNYPKSFFLLLVQRRVHGQSVLRLRRTDAFKKKKKKRKMNLIQWKCSSVEKWSCEPICFEGS